MMGAEGNLRLKGKVAVVTGGSRGLGAAIAGGFADAGASVVVTSRKIESCRQVVSEIEARGGTAMAYACHVGHWDELPGLVEATIQRFGKIDILVNNAGIAPGTPKAIDVTEELFDKTFNVNTKATFRLSALVAEKMMAGDGGSIINISSIGAIRPEPVYSVYAAAKAGVNTLTKAQAMEFGPKVRVNAIMAGPFWSDMTKSWRDEYEANPVSALKRMARPHEIVSTALYFAEDASSYTTGTTIRVDGGIL